MWPEEMSPNFAPIQEAYSMNCVITNLISVNGARKEPTLKLCMLSKQLRMTVNGNNETMIKMTKKKASQKLQSLQPNSNNTNIT
jgi:hypothetical protein